MYRPVVLLCLLAQLLLTLLPGDGLVLCFGATGRSDASHSLGAHADHRDPCGDEHSPVHHDDRGDDCDGLHVTRGEAECWLHRPAPEAPPAAQLVLTTAPLWCLAPCPAATADPRPRHARRGPPPRLAAAFVKTTVLRI